MPDLTLAEAAKALGFSVDTVRRGVTRGTGPLSDLLRDAGRRTNSGQWVITLSDTQIIQHRQIIGQHRPATNTVAYAGADQHNKIAASDPFRESPEQTIPISVMRTAFEDRDRLHAEIVAGIRQDHRATVAMMVERVDAAEIRAERVEQRLDQILDQLLEQRRPWWARLLELWRRR